MEDIEKQTRAIKLACKEICEFLVQKNTSYGGSVFKDMQYAGQAIPAEHTINIRITDKIRRLQSTDPNFNGEDSEADLLGYLLLKRALKTFREGT